MRIKQVKATFNNIFKNSFVFKGRTSRVEYLYFIVGIFAWLVTINVLLYPALVDLFLMIIAFPLLSATVRRLHDSNKSGIQLLLFAMGYWLLAYSRTATLGFNFDAGFRMQWLAVIGGAKMIVTIYLLYALSCRGSAGTNSYGEKPLDHHLFNN